MQKRIFTLFVICMVLAGLEGNLVFAASRVYGQAEGTPQGETLQETGEKEGAVQLSAPHGVLMEAST